MSSPGVPYEGDRLIAIAAVSFCLTTVSLIGRCYARFRIKKQPVGADDWLLFLAYICALGMDIAGIYGAKLAYVGYHFKDALAMDPNAYEPWSKLIFGEEFVYLAAISLPKLSILALYLRIFVGNTPRRCIFALMGLVIAYWVAFFVVCWVQCIPLAGVWDQSIDADCIDIETYYKFVSLPSAIIDVFILALPIPLIWRLQATLARRLTYVGIFLCGSLGLVACCIRMALFFLSDAFHDPTWASVYLIGITVLEPSLYIIAACLLAMHPLFQLWYDKLADTAFFARFVSASKDTFRRMSIERRPSRQPPPIEEIDLERGQTGWLGAKPKKGKFFSSARGSRAARHLPQTSQEEVGLRRDVWVQQTRVDP